MGALLAFVGVGFRVAVAAGDLRLLPRDLPCTAGGPNGGDWVLGGWAVSGWAVGDWVPAGCAAVGWAVGDWRDAGWEVGCGVVGIAVAVPVAACVSGAALSLWPLSCASALNLLCLSATASSYIARCSAMSVGN